MAERAGSPRYEHYRRHNISGHRVTSWQWLVEIQRDEITVVKRLRLAGRAARFVTES